MEEETSRWSAEVWMGNEKVENAREGRKCKRRRRKPDGHYKDHTGPREDFVFKVGREPSMPMD